MAYPDLSHLNDDQKVKARNLLDELNLLNIAIAQDEAGIRSEENAINELDKEINILVIRQDDIKILKENAEWKINVQCDDLKNNKRERKCKDAAVKIVDDYQRDLLNLEPYLATVGARLQARIDRKAAKNESKNYKRDRVADSIYELSLLGIDARSQLASSILEGIADVGNAAANIVGAGMPGGSGPGLPGGNNGGSSPGSGGPFPNMPFIPFEDGLEDGLKDGASNTTFYIVIVVAVVLAIGAFLKFKK